MIKKIKVILLASATLLMTYCVNADSTVVSGVTWYYERFSSGGKDCACITGCDKYAGDLSIPSSFTLSFFQDPLPVTHIGNSAFYKCEGLTSVTIPSGIMSIGDSAFRECSGLMSVVIPASVTSIGEYAFCACSGVRYVSMPTSVTRMSIGKYAFAGCGKLKSKMSIPSGVTSIGEHAFDGCGGLESLIIPASVTSIGDYAFYGCSGLGFVDDSSSVSSIGEGTFAYCSGLWWVSLPKQVTRIGKGAFFGCSGLTDAYLWSNVMSIGISAFAGCSRLRSMTIPESVEEIGASAFENCIGLMSVTISHGVKVVGIEAFRGCSELTSIVIPSTVTTIESGAFRDCSGLISVAMRASKIGGDAFLGCNALEVVCVGVENQAFYRKLLVDSGLDVDKVRIVDQYTMTFNANGGMCSPSSLQCSPWLALDAMPTPVRVGYAFDGWYTSANDGTKVEAPVAVTGDMTLYAHWNANVYTITFNANGGSCAETSRSREYGAAYGTLPTPTRTGYLFLGWYTAQTGGASVSTTTVMAGNVTLYAQWEKRKEYSVSFDADGGSSPETSRMIYSGDAVGTLPTPTYLRLRA